MVERQDIDEVGEFLWDLLTDAPPSPEDQQDAMIDGILGALEEAGFRGVSPSDLEDALDGLSGQLTEQQEAQLDPLREAIANQPDPVIEQYITHEAPEPDTVVQNVTEVTNVYRTINQEGDQVVDQSVRTTIFAEGDVDFDQTVENTANVGDDGAVVVGGDVDDSAINTGEFDGVQAGGDIDIEDSIVGDENALITDTESDAIAVGGDATAVDSGAAPPEPELPPADDAADGALGEAPDFEEPSFDDAPAESAMEEQIALEEQMAEAIVDDVTLELDA